GTSFWEVPGGSLDPHRAEDPLDAAKRELQEETGFTSDSWKVLGVHSPNPAIQANKLHTYLAVNCKKTHDLSLDPYEDLEVHLRSVKETKQMLKEGGFTHSLMVASLALAL